MRAAAALRYTHVVEKRLTVPELLPPGHRPDCRRLEKVRRLVGMVPLSLPSFQDGMEGGGYALGTGNSPATYVRLENFYAMHEEGFAHGRYGTARA